MRLFFSSGISWWSAAALFGAAAALVYLAYPRRVRALAGPRWRAPFFCRAAASLALFLLLARPEIDVIERRPEAQTLLILLDRSASMGLKEANGTSRLRRAALAARDSERLLADAPALLPLIVPFAAAPGAPLSGDDLLTATAAGDETDICRALQAAAAIRPPVRRIVLLSDGNDTTGLDPVAAAAALRVPVDTVAIGEERSDAKTRDVWLTGVERRDNAPIGSVLPITAQVDAVGYAGQTCRAVLRCGDQVLGSGEIIIDDQPGSQALTLNFFPPATGVWDLMFMLEPLPGENNGDNNLLSFPVAVHERLPRVVYVEGAIRPDFKFLRRGLATDPGLEFLSLVRVREAEFLRQGEISGLTLEKPPTTAAEWAACDVFILGELQARELGPAAATALVEAIRQGLGLLLLASPATTGSQSDWPGSPLAPALPALPSGEHIAKPLRLKLTATGKEHPAFSHLTSWLESAEAELTIASIDIAREPRPGVEILISGQPAEGGREWPALICGTYGKGRTAIFWGREIWRWHMSPAAAAAAARFWGQLVRWLAGKEDALASAEEFTLRADRLVMPVGEEIGLYAAVRAAGTAKPRVDAAVMQNDKEVGSIGFAAAPGSEGLFVARFSSQRPGTYAIVAKAKADGREIGERRVTVRVRGGRGEFARLSPDRSLLSRLAQETGGKEISLGDLAEEIAALASSDRSLCAVRRIRLWHAPGLFIALALFLSAEWLWRKRAALP